MSKVIWKSNEWRRQVLSLYRNILRTHKKKLSPEQMYLGNRYVQNEFRLNKTANEAQSREFMKEWRKYLAVITEAPDYTKVGRDLTEEEIENMTQEQREQLAQLKEESTKYVRSKRKGENVDQD